MSVSQTGADYTRTTAGGYANYPVGGAGGTPFTGVLSSATPATFGAWVEFTSSTASEIAIVGINCSTSGAGIVIDIGKGGAGTEVSLGYFHMGYTIASNQVISLTFLPYPIIIPAGTRVAVRAADNTGSTTLNISLAYIPTGSLV